jgi:hypothetical protein
MLYGIATAGAWRLPDHAVNDRVLASGSKYPRITFALTNRLA